MRRAAVKPRVASPHTFDVSQPAVAAKSGEKDLFCVSGARSFALLQTGGSWAQSRYSGLLGHARMAKKTKHCATPTSRETLKTSLFNTAN